MKSSVLGVFFTVILIQLITLISGAGKSLCYQLPAAMADHQITIVFSPLIALMKDQIDKANQKGILAKTLNSSKSIK